MADIQKKLRLRYIQHGLIESRKRLDDSLKEHNSIPINASLSEVLFWINGADEWHSKNRNENNVYLNKKKSDNGGQCLLGLRFVYNAIKHDMDFTKAIISTDVKPLLNSSDYFIEDYTSKPKWIKAEGIGNKVFKNLREQKRYDSQRKNYRCYLESKDVIATIDNAINFIKNVNSDYFLNSSIQQELL